jgi:phenylpropionate dioxygenase-like ring-hydroxylating dioxygenase large terminal subunit
VLTAEENDLLCRVEGDAPMGQLMRRHWIPAALSEQLAEPDGTPVPLRILGEDLVAFRDSDGRLGVLDARCPHRKASLVLGRNEDCGLRCLYHGWKFDVEGNLLEMPSEPAASGLAEKVKHKAYPVREGAGFVWIYMGPADSIPEFEAPPWAPSGKERVSIVRIDVPCNWAQIMEGQIDSAHSSSLHSSDMRPARVETAAAADTHWLRPSTDKSPRLQVQLTNYGFRYAAIRRPDQGRADARLCADHDLCCALHRADPAQQFLQCHQRHRPQGRHEHLFPLHRMERTRRHRSGSLAQILRRPGRNRSRPRLSANAAIHGEQISSGPDANEAWKFHRHYRHSQSGHRHVDHHGTDCRPHQRAARRQRYRRDPVPAPHDRSGQALPVGRGRDRPASNRNCRRPSCAPIRGSSTRKKTGGRSARRRKR